MAFEQTQTRYGVYPAGEDLTNKRYHSVQLNESAKGKTEIIIGNRTVGGILFNTPIAGQAAHIVMSGIVPAILSEFLTEPVEIGDMLAPREDGTLMQGEGPYEAAAKGNAGECIEILVGPSSRRENFTFNKVQADHLVTVRSGQQMNVHGTLEISEAGLLVIEEGGEVSLHDE